MYLTTAPPQSEVREVREVRGIFCAAYLEAYTPRGPYLLYIVYKNKRYRGGCAGGPAHAVTHITRERIGKRAKGV